MIKRRIFNPLDYLNVVTVTSLSDSEVPESKATESTSAFFNDHVGICPKCGSAMSTAVLANNDTVFFCLRDRVALPRPDSIV